MPNNYVITKMECCSCGEPTELVYWNVDCGWVHDFDEASLFPRDILGQPLPRGASCILEVTEEGEPVDQFSVIDIHPLP